jgi:hypothetical protein
MQKWPCGQVARVPLAQQLVALGLRTFRPVGHRLPGSGQVAASPTAFGGSGALVRELHGADHLEVRLQFAQ